MAFFNCSFLIFISLVTISFSFSHPQSFIRRSSNPVTFMFYSSTFSTFSHNCNFIQSSRFMSDNQEDEKSDYMLKRTSVQVEIPRNITSSPSSPVNQPLFGEWDLDGSILVLAPAFVIAVLGLFSGVLIAVNAGDDDVRNGDLVGATVTVIEQDMDTNSKCRGICQDQASQLESISNTMNGLSSFYRNVR